MLPFTRPANGSATIASSNPRRRQSGSGMGGGGGGAKKGGGLKALFSGGSGGGGGLSTAAAAPGLVPGKPMEPALLPTVQVCSAGGERGEGERVKRAGLDEREREARQGLAPGPRPRGRARARNARGPLLSPPPLSFAARPLSLRPPSSPHGAPPPPPPTPPPPHTHAHPTPPTHTLTPHPPPHPHPCPPLPFPSPPRKGGHVLVGAPTGAWQLILVTRGRACPVSRNYLAAVDGAAADLDALGVEVLALTADGRERAEAFVEEVKAVAGGGEAGFKLAYGLAPETAGAWGLYLSAGPAPGGTGWGGGAGTGSGGGGSGGGGAGAAAASIHPEPGVILLTPDGDVSLVLKSSSAFGWADLRVLVEGIRFMQEKGGWPVGGTVGLVEE